MQGLSNIWKSVNVIHHKDKLQEKIHMIISLDSEEAFDKNPTPFHDKGLREIRDTRNISKHYKRNL